MRPLHLLAVLAVSCAPHLDERAVANNYAARLHVAGNLARAETIYREVLDEGFEPARLHLGICLRDQGRLDEALACILDAQSDPDGPFQLGVTYTALGRHAEAAGIYLALIDDDPLTEYNALAALDDAGVSIDIGPVLTRVSDSDPLFPYILALDHGNRDAQEEAQWRMNP